MIIGPISLIFCGHLSDAIKLDGAALAISVSNTYSHVHDVRDVTSMYMTSEMHVKTLP